MTQVTVFRAVLAVGILGMVFAAAPAVTIGRIAEGAEE